MATATEETTRTTWEIDPAHSIAEFTVKHMMFTTVRGRFTAIEGSITVDEENPDQSSVEVHLDAASIDTGNDDRDQHLRSADFLDVEKHPRLVFRSKRVEGAAFEEGESFTVVGDLEIRGTTREVELDATYGGRGTDPWGGTRAGFSADTKIDRRDWELTWNQALESGGVLVGHDVKLDLDVQAVKQDG
jgi:polyisoprenoid-binding protein YceI